MERVFDLLQRIQQLWTELEGTPPNTSKYTALMKKIRALSEEYKALIDAPKKPRDSR